MIWQIQYNSEEIELMSMCRRASIFCGRESIDVIVHRQDDVREYVKFPPDKNLKEIEFWIKKKIEGDGTVIENERKN